MLLMQLMNPLGAVPLCSYASNPNVGEAGEERAGVLAESIWVAEVGYEVDEQEACEGEQRPGSPVEVVEEHGDEFTAGARRGLGETRRI